DGFGRIEQPGEFLVRVLDPTWRHGREATLAHARLETEPTVAELLGQVRPLLSRAALFLHLEYGPHDARGVRDYSHAAPRRHLSFCAASPQSPPTVAVTVAGARAW